VLSENEFSVFDFASCISDAIDLISPIMQSHHKKVAYFSYNIAMQMNLPDDMIRDIVLAAVLHDIGAFSDNERTKIVSAGFDEGDLAVHAEMGYKLLKSFEPLQNAAKLIQMHHACYDKMGDAVPIGSYVVHLADRIAVTLDDSKEVFEQIPKVMEKIEENCAVFHPAALDALRALENVECFWIEACSISVSYSIPDRMKHIHKIIDTRTLRDFAKVVANFIDYRSRFTSTHSSGVAAVALELTRLSGFSESECDMMEIAGFLHDVGKLAISNDILEKKGALSEEEVNEMRKHTYYTYVILNKIKGLEHISTWAAYHHEKLDGKGYPFHIKGAQFTKLARIMAVADIFTAITEDRPYRSGMNEDEAMRVLNNMVINGSIDPIIVKLTEDNFEHINTVRICAQKVALEEYMAFH